MRKLAVAALLPVLLLSFARAEDARMPATITPAIKDKNRHDNFVKLAQKGGIDLLFQGDSITDNWRSVGKAVWEKDFAPLNAANFGIGGDKTQHVLWRIQNGELEGIKPKLVVLMIGTNNAGDHIDDVALGITTIVREFQKRLPESKILLLGIFPRGANAGNNLRDKNSAVNALIAKLDDGKMLKYMDIGDKFLDADKNIPLDIMKDSLHPTAKGYQIWSDAILPTVNEMMK